MKTVSPFLGGRHAVVILFFILFILSKFPAHAWHFSFPPSAGESSHAVFQYNAAWNYTNAAGTTNIWFPFGFCYSGTTNIAIPSTVPSPAWFAVSVVGTNFVATPYTNIIVYNTNTLAGIYTNVSVPPPAPVTNTITQ